jgi:hypothetical protein
VTQKRNRKKILVGKLEGRDHFEDLGIGKTLLKSISHKYGGEVWNNFVWLTAGSEIGLCGHSNEPLGSMKGRKCLE